MSVFGPPGGGGSGGPPGPFGFGPRPGGGGMQPFSSPPSSSPASSHLYQRTAGVHLPELLGFIRIWHKGKWQRDSKGERIMLTWHALEVIHLDTATVIYVHTCDKNEQDEDVAAVIEQRIEHRTRGMGDGSMQRYEVRCHFRSDDGVYTAWEPYTVPLTLPPATPSWGQPHYGGMGPGGGGFGGVSSYSGGSGGGGLGGPGAFGASLHRGYIDATQMAHNVLFRALDMVENHSRRLEAANARHEEREMDRMRLMDELQSTAMQRRLAEQMAELKMAALQTAMEKFFAALPLGFVVLNRWINGRKDEKAGEASPRERKAWETLRRLTDELQKNPQISENPQMLRMMLQGAGATEETVDDMFQTFQEFAFDKMMSQAEQNTKKQLLGINDSDTGIKRLLKVAGVQVPGEEPANEDGGDASSTSGGVK